MSSEQQPADIPDDCGVESTNAPGLSVLWERHRATVRVTLMPAPAPESDWQSALPGTQWRP